MHERWMFPRLQAERFAREHRGRDPVASMRPDAPGMPSRPEGLPDFVFRYDAGPDLVLEMKMVLQSPAQMKVESVVRKVCLDVEDRVGGPYELEVRVDQAGRNLPTRAALAEMIVDAATRGGPLPKGLRLRRGQGGRGIAAGFFLRDIPVGNLRDPRLPRIAAEAQRLLRRSNKKFTGYEGERVVLLDISPTGLNFEGHLRAVEGWVREIRDDLPLVDKVCVDLGVRVWRLEGGKFVRRLNDHALVTASPGWYPVVWSSDGAG